MPTPQRFVPTTATICNMAIAHLGVGRQIVNISDNSDEAKTCNLYYDQARDQVLRDFNWPFARKWATLTLVGGTNTQRVTADWQYSYRVPTDSLRVRRIANDLRYDDNRTRVPFVLGQDATGRLIYTDLQVMTVNGFQTPQLEYTAEITDETQFDTDFVDAFSYYLAWKIAPRLTSGDQFGVGKAAYANYREQIDKARANALNEEGLDPDPDSQFIRERL